MNGDLILLSSTKTDASRADGSVCVVLLICVSVLIDGYSSWMELDLDGGRRCVCLGVSDEHDDRPRMRLRANWRASRSSSQKRLDKNPHKSIDNAKLFRCCHYRPQIAFISSLH